MKILMLTWEYPPRIVGGIARVVHDLSKRLIKDGHEVTVITYRDGNVPEYENDKGVEVYRVDNYMIHPNNFIDWIMQLNFNMIAKATEVIVNSNYMKGHVQGLFGLPFDKISVIPNGINLNNFTGIDRDYDFRRRFAMDNEKIILYVGRLVYEKGVQHLISAMPKILENYHDSKLVIAGKGGMIDELKSQVDSMGLSNKVYFTGYLNQKEVQKMYKCADVAVFPSTYEPFGIVALEAMLAGIPTVVSDIGGLNEIVEHGVNGMKSYTGNPNSIADSVLSLLFDPQLAMNVTKNAKNKVKDEFNWQKIAQDTHYIYELAISKTMAQRQAEQLEQEKAKKTTKARNTDNEVINLLKFRKRHAYA